jgi:hypothetical protein
MSLFAPCARSFALKTRQHEIRQAQFGVARVIVHRLPTYLALSPNGTHRHRNGGDDEAFPNVGDANPRRMINRY